ncbi:MAG: Uncharacterized protein FD157_1771 [Rhodocyclaceae bacterium]|nr:MAG: Uncharacterized protein FD157_1771 [Rhodocyclaceae bacterium]TND00077.1 MAG: Uncharacterized protein FD118_3395 [Rhodocyclaceae bacterium]
MRTSGRHFHALALILGFSVGGCSTDIFKHTKGTTYGDITVGDARVSSRERLVNDRLTQDAWLKDELRRSDQQEFGFQGAADLRSFVGSSTRLEANANQVEIAQYRAQAAQSADAGRRQQEQAELDNQLLRQYKQRQMEAMAQQSSSAFAFTPPTGKPDASPTTAVPTSPTVVEDVRKLKDDVGKFTIDPSTLKFPDKLKPSPQEVLRDKLEYRGLIRTEMLENALDDRHDLKGNTLLRFDVDAAVRPDDDTSAWAIITVEVDTRKWEKACLAQDLYGRWVSHVGMDLRERTLLLMRRGFEAGRAAEAEKGPKASQAEKDAAFIAGMVAFLPDYVLLEIQRDWLDKSESYRTSSEIVMERARRHVRKQTPDREELRQQIYIEISAAHQRLLTRLLPKYVNAGFQSDGRTLRVLKNVKGADEKATGNEDKAEAQMRAEEFCAELHDKAEIFAYASTPKESVQRISEVASRRNVSEFMLALSFLAGNSAAGKLYTDYMKVSEGIFQAIHRQPLVVGFSKGTYKTDIAEKADGKMPCDLKAQTEPVERCTSFGWILGPRFAIKNDGSGSHYRHTVAFNSLSGVISLPGWLNEVDFRVRTQWVNDDGFVPAKPVEKTMPVRLNPDFTTITDVLAQEAIREPRPFTRQALEFEEGAAATIVIPGQNLWRNPVVLLGSQQADEVTVLPDMRGLVAKFKEIKLQRPKGSTEKDLLVVWTSEGHADAALVKINPAKVAPPAAPDPKATLASNAAIGGQMVEINLAPPQKSFFGMTVFFGSLGTAEHKTEDITNLLNSGAGASVKTPTFPKMKSGDELLVQVAVKAAPDIRPPQPFGGPITAIYYKTDEDSKAKLQPAQLTLKALKDSVFTVSFPVKAAVAYPGSDAEKLDVVLEVKGGKGPAAKGTSCTRDSTKKTVDQCEFKVTFDTEPEAAVEYTVKVMAKGKPIPLSPDTIKITQKEEANAVPTPEAKTGKVVAKPVTKRAAKQVAKP